MYKYHNSGSSSKSATDNNSTNSFTNMQWKQCYLNSNGGNGLYLDTVNRLKCNNRFVCHHQSNDYNHLYYNRN